MPRAGPHISTRFTLRAQGRRATASEKTQREVNRGRVYLQSVLTELGQDVLDDWMARVAVGSDDAFRLAVNTLVPGCTLRVNHAGTCDAMCCLSPRTPCRLDYGRLAGGKRSRDM